MGTMFETPGTAVVAIGGNSLIKDKQHQTVADQYIAAQETCRHIVAMIQEGWNVAISHGNGPQVGFILRRSELAAHEMHEVPLDVCGADSQGAIGYALQQNLCNEFRRLGVAREAATVICQTEVAADDPAFKNPTKPIGGFMDEEQAERRRKEGWDIVNDANRGFRRVVASPAASAHRRAARHQGPDRGRGGRGHRRRGRDPSGRRCGRQPARCRRRHRQGPRLGPFGQQPGCRPAHHLDRGREGGAELRHARRDPRRPHDAGRGQGAPGRGRALCRRQHGAEDPGGRQLPLQRWDDGDRDQSRRTSPGPCTARPGPCSRWIDVTDGFDGTGSSPRPCRGAEASRWNRYSGTSNNTSVCGVPGRLGDRGGAGDDSVHAEWKAGRGRRSPASPCRACVRSST